MVIWMAQIIPTAIAPVISDPDALTSAYEALQGQWFSAIMPLATELFWAFAALEMSLFGWNLWMSYNGDIRSAMLATANKVLIIGMFLALLLNAGVWMSAIINSFITVGKTASGIPSLSPGIIMMQGVQIAGVMLKQSTDNGLLLHPATAGALVIAGLIIFLAFVAIAFQFLVTKIQTFIALGAGVIFLGFGGSKWTTPYVERYFAFCVACGCKLMVLYLLVGGGWFLTNSWLSQANSFATSGNVVELYWVIMGGALMFAMVCWYSSSQVSALLGGSPNLSHTDLVSFMAPMVSGAVTAGMLAAGVASGGAGAAAGAAASAAGAAGGGSGGGGASPSGATPPQPSGSSGGGGSSAASTAAGMARAGASAMSSMPSGSGHAAPPQFSGFGH
jgi:type IV secretion system protein TrbL